MNEIRRSLRTGTRDMPGMQGMQLQSTAIIASTQAVDSTQRWTPGT